MLEPPIAPQGLRSGEYRQSRRFSAQNACAESYGDKTGGDGLGDLLGIQAALGADQDAKLFGRWQVVQGTAACGGQNNPRFMLCCGFSKQLVEPQ